MGFLRTILGSFRYFQTEETSAYFGYCTHRVQYIKIILIRYHPLDSLRKTIVFVILGFLVSCSVILLQ